MLYSVAACNYSMYGSGVRDHIPCKVVLAGAEDACGGNCAGEDLLQADRRPFNPLRAFAGETSCTNSGQGRLERRRSPQSCPHRPDAG